MRRLALLAVIVVAATALVPVPAGAQPSPDTAYHALTPVRILDTRTGNGSPATPLGPRTTRHLTVAGRAGLPTTGIGAVVVNLTATNATLPGYVVAWPGDRDRPDASNLNLVPGRDVANLAVVPVAPTARSRCIPYGSTDLVADLVGWYPTDADLRTLTPTRILDTRTGNGSPATPLGPRTTRHLTVAGRAGLPTTGIGAVVVNLTATEATARSFVTSWPGDRTRPDASTLNTEPGVDVPNLAVVPVGADGTVSLYNDAGTTHLVADLVGWYATDADLRTLTPTRILDTRTGNGSPATPLGARTTRHLTVAGRAGLPTTGIGAGVVNLTATEATAASYVTAWPKGFTRPNASTLNAVAGLDIANPVILPLGADGAISLYNDAGTLDLIADLVAWIPADAVDAPPPPPPPAECPLFPADSHWYADVSTLPVHPRSAAWVSSIGVGAGLKADFGSGLWNGGPIGIPYVEVDGSTPRSSVAFTYADESDPGPYPIPADRAHRGWPGIDRRPTHPDGRDRRLPPVRAVRTPTPTGRAGGRPAPARSSTCARTPCGRRLDLGRRRRAADPARPGALRRGGRRRDRPRHPVHRAADPAGLCLAGPASGGRATIRTCRRWVQRFRLKTSRSTSAASRRRRPGDPAGPAERYGMILADNGSRWFLSGAPDERWDNDVLQLLGQVKGSDFEAVDVSSLVVHPDSGAITG